MTENSLKNPQKVTDSPKVTDYDGLHRFNWRQFWLVSKPAKNRHNPSPVTFCEKTSVSTPSEPLQTVSAAAQSTLRLAESAERTARIRAMAQLVSPEELLKVRRRLSPAIRRNSSADEINEMLLCQCLLDKGIEPYSVLHGDGERVPDGESDQQRIAEARA